MNNISVRHEKLVEATKKMRNYQIRYFKYRISEDLKKAKYFESVVDRLLSEETPPIVQTNLFQ